MLDGYIIEELRRREEAERQRDNRPRIELPIPDHGERPAHNREERHDDAGSDRGVIVIDL